MPARPSTAAPAPPVPTPATSPATPTIRRRLACLLYEGVLLFGVLSASTALYLAARPLLRALRVDTPLTMQLWSFLAMGLYFSWFWQRSGQTLPMQTWGIRVENARGEPPSWPQAVWRYVLAWLWLPPSAALGHALGLIKGPFLAVLAAGLAVWVMLAWLDPRRQFLHDRLARTRLVDLRAAQRQRDGGAAPTAKR